MYLHVQRNKLDHFPDSDLFADLQKAAYEALRECTCMQQWTASKWNREHALA